MRYKNWTKGCSAIVLILVFCACSSGRKLNSNPPETWELPYLQNSKRGFQLVLRVQRPNTQIPDSIYFRQRRAKLQPEGKDLITYIGYFDREPSDLIMNSEGHEEFGNPIPTALTQKDLPFDLEANECVVSYFCADKKCYTKFANISEKH